MSTYLNSNKIFNLNLLSILTFKSILRRNNFHKFLVLYIENILIKEVLFKEIILSPLFISLLT